MKRYFVVVAVVVAVETNIFNYICIYIYTLF